MVGQNLSAVSRVLSRCVLSIMIGTAVLEADAALLYEENFNSDVGLGIYYESGVVVTALPDEVYDPYAWTITPPANVSASLRGVDDRLRVINLGSSEFPDGRLEAQDLDGRFIWKSPVLEFGPSENLELSMKIYFSGDFESSAQPVGAADLLRVDVIQDGSLPASVVYNKTFIDEGGVGSQTQDTQGLDEDSPVVALTGESIQIIVSFENQSHSEIMWIDDIQITGTLLPEPGMALIATGLMLLGARRNPRTAR